MLKKLTVLLAIVALLFVGVLLADEATEYHLMRGWNMIGGANVVLPSSILEDVEEVIPPIFRYNPSTRAYETADSLIPLNGYWVLCSDDVIVSITDTLDVLCPSTVTDIDGNVYETVLIGEQCWMAENLKTTRYRTGTAIPHVTNSIEWRGLDATETGAYCEYDNNSANVATYGRLYNWYAVDDARGLCPSGWRVPSDDDFKVLEIYLGMDPTEANATGRRGTDQGSQLAGGYDLWASGALRSNAAFGTSGFTALPGGYRSDNGHYYLVSSDANFWSSSESSSTNAWGRYLYYDLADVGRYSYDKRYGFSVRCLRDD